MWRSLRRLLTTAESGVAALEFALVAPVLVILYVGTIEVSLALMASRKLSLAAAATAELTSQGGTIDAATVADIFTASRAMLEPFDAGSLTQRVTAIVVDDDRTARVAWSVGAGIEGLAPGSPVAVPANLIIANEGLVMAEAWLDYASPMGFAMPGSRQFSERHFIYPRVKDRVLWETAS